MGAELRNWVIDWIDLNEMKGLKMNEQEMGGLWGKEERNQVVLSFKEDAIGPRESKREM